MTNLVILHGWQSSKEKWQIVKEIIEKQSEDRPRLIRIIVPDLSGFKKETELSKPWNLDNYINWLENFISENSKTSCPEPVEGFYLLGHSFGGRMAIKFAVKHPEKLKGLILVSSAGIKPKQNILYLTFLAYAKKFKWFFLKIPVLRNFFSFFRNIFYKYILRKTDYLEAEKFPYLKETFKNIIKEDLTGELSKIKVPTLIIWGDRDKMTPLSDAYLMKEKIKNSRLEIMEGVAHTPHLENPKILVQKIKKFMEEQI